MKNKQKFAFLFRTGFLFAIISFWNFTAEAQGVYTHDNFQDNNKRTVEVAVQEFYLALNAVFAGDVEPMKKVWSHADDVTYMGPGGGLREGWAEVLADWEAQAAMKPGGKVQPQDLHITVGSKIAVVVNEEKGENTDANGNVQPVAIRATHVLRKEGGKWKMIGDHTDLLPYLSGADSGKNDE